jgi:hypothetical protein
MAALLRWFETLREWSPLAGLDPKRELDSFDSNESRSTAVRDEPAPDRPWNRHAADLAGEGVSMNPREYEPLPPP